MFGFGYSDEKDEKQSSGGLLSGIWSGIKAIGIAILGAVLAVATFKFSPKTKDFIDKYTGGAASWLVGIADKITGKIDERLNPSPTASDVSTIIETKDGKALATKPQLTNSVKDVAEHSVEYDALKDMKAARAKFSADNHTITAEAKSAGNIELNEKQKNLFKTGENIVAWNEATE